MTQKITLRIWNKYEAKVTRSVEIPNVLSVTFETKYKEITFCGNEIEIFIVPHLNDIEFDFTDDKKYVFITVKDREEQ